MGDVTTEVAEAVLFAGFGSEAADETLTEFVILVPGLVAGATVTTREKVEMVFAATVGFVHVSTPPTGGGQIHPAGTVSETNVVLAGSVSVSLTPVAEAGPLFVTVTV